MLTDRMRLRGPVAGLLLLVAWYAVPWARMGVVAEVVGAPLWFLAAFTAPGIALARLLDLGPRDRLETFAVDAVLGMAVAMAAAFVCALAGVGPGVLHAAYPVVVVVVWIVALRRRVPRRVALDRDAATPAGRAALWVLAGLLALVAVLLWTGGPLATADSDTIDHLAYVREILRTHHLFPTTAFYIHPGADGADLRKGLLHVWYAVFAGGLGLGPLRVFAFFNAALLVVVAGSVYAAARWMFDRRVVATTSAVLFLLGFEGGIGDALVRATFYPNRVGLAPLLLMIAAMVCYVARPRRVLLVLCALFAFTAAAIHVQYCVFAAAAAAVVVAWKTCLPRADWGTHLRRSVTASVWAGAAIAPYALYRALSYQANANHTVVQGVVFVGRWGFIADPERVWTWLGWFGLAALAACVPWWARRREHAGTGYTIAALLSVIVVLFVPVVLPVVFHGISYLSFRLGRIVPYYMLAALVTVGAFSWRRRRGVGAFFEGVALAAIAVGVVAGVGSAFGGAVLGPNAHQRRENVARWRVGIDAVARALPAGSVIASDPMTSYFLAAFTPDYVVCTLDQHAPPNDLRLRERITAARDILSPFTTVAEKVRLMEREDAGYVVLNTDVPLGMVLDYWTLDPPRARAVRKVFDDHPALFEPVVSAGSFTAWRWTGRRPDAATAGDRAQAPPEVSALPAGAAHIGAISGEARLVAASVSRAAVAWGDTLSVTAYWTRPRAMPPDNYEVGVRFDKIAKDLPLGGRPFPKVTRKIVEHIRGERYRFRADHMLLDGFYGPDRWTDGEVVRDATTVRIPRDVAPGEYSVQVRMFTVAPAPNTTLGSWFFDRDMFTGVEIGRVRIAARGGGAR